MDTPSDIQSNLPLTEVTYFILVSLAPSPRHGYAIMKDVRSLSHQRVNLSTGTLYGALKRLLEQGWITRTNDPAPSGTARVRKAYRLTSLGRAVLQAEIERLDHLVAAAHRRRLGDNG
jgi:DNA-binding PadR family transcriptional regulator